VSVTVGSDSVMEENTWFTGRSERGRKTGRGKGRNVDASGVGWNGGRNEVTQGRNLREECV